jgi:DNA-directed RNA polymerase specialized sigma24 family protein
MPLSAQQVLKSSLTRLVKEGTGEPPRVMYRLAASALRNAGGGRIPEAGAEFDLVQDFFIKVWTRRRREGSTALVTEWEQMAPAVFSAYVKRSLRNLAVERNPVWNRQRGLRDAIEGALEAGLPAATAWPEALEKNGRYARALVARACAAAIAEGTAAEVKPLTTRLMAAFSFTSPIDPSVDVEAAVSTSADALEQLAARTAGEAVVTAFLAEVGPEGRELLRLRRLGFKEMARHLGVALATAHARFVRCEARLKEIAARVGADREALEQAVEALAT